MSKIIIINFFILNILKIIIIIINQSGINFMFLKNYCHFNFIIIITIIINLSKHKNSTNR